LRVQEPAWAANGPRDVFSYTITSLGTTTLRKHRSTPLTTLDCRSVPSEDVVSFRPMVRDDRRQTGISAPLAENRSTSRGGSSLIED
jgi:hypothetical protein